MTQLLPTWLHLNCARNASAFRAGLSCYPRAINFLVLSALTEQLTRAVPLADDQVTVAIEQLVSEQVLAETKADFLIALAQKGETEQEICAFARELRGRSIQPPVEA